MIEGFEKFTYLHTKFPKKQASLCMDRFTTF